MEEPDPSPRSGLDELLDQLGDIKAETDDPGMLKRLEKLGETAANLETGFFGRTIKKYTTRDMAEAVVGSLILSVPLLVEDGVYEIADHFLETAVFGIPAFFLWMNFGFVVLVTIAVLYWADFQRVVPCRPLFGVVPRRLLGTLVISLVTVALMMTMWGRLDGWSDPAVAFARISCIWAPAAFGAALGDILPGSSKGPDISEAFG